MKKIVITGAGGFVGKNLAAYLEKEGHRVFRVSLRNPEWEAAIPPDADAVVHLAGLAHDLKNTNRTADYFRVNTGLTREVFDFFTASSARDFIFLSSVKAVCDNPGASLLDEDYPADPATAYGRSKLEAERYILARDVPGKRACVLRPCMIHGPGNKGNLNFLYKLVSRGVPYPLGAYRNSRSFLSVENLCFVIARICAGGIPSGVYNVADSEPLSTLEVLDVLHAATGRKPRIWRVPPALVTGLARLGDILRLPLNSERLQKLTENYRVGNRKILAALREPGGDLPLSARRGLLRTFESFAKEKEKEKGKEQGKG